MKNNVMISINRIRYRMPMARVPCVLIFLIALSLSSCGTSSGVGGDTLFTVTARNDIHGYSFVTSGSNPDVEIPVIINDTVVQLTDVLHDNVGRSGALYNYNAAAPTWDPINRIWLSRHLDGGNPNFLPFPDPSNMDGSIIITNEGNNFQNPEDVIITYNPVSNGHGVDWFRYSPVGLVGESDTAYVIVRFIKIEEDAYEPDDFIQFAHDITQFVTKNIGTNYREGHNSDYPNLGNRDAPIFYRIIPDSSIGWNINGDRDWFLVRIPTNENNLAIEIKTLIPKVMPYGQRSSSNRDDSMDIEADLGVTLIEEVSGVPLVYANIPNFPTTPVLHYTQNTDISGPRPYNAVARSINLPPLFQNNRQNEDNLYPTPLWFKWPLDVESGFLGTRRLFIRINPKGSRHPPVVPEHHKEFIGDYRVDFRLLQKGF